MKAARAALTAFLVLLVATSAVGLAGAQEATSTATPAPTNDSAENEVIADVDSIISIVSYRYERENETMVIELRNDGDVDRDVTITEIVTSEDSRGSKSSLRFGIAIVEVDAGETLTARVDVRDRGDAAGVTVTTAESAQAGHGEALMVDLNSGPGGLIQGKPTGGQVRAGAFAGGLGSIVVMILGAWQYVAAKNEEVQEADLSPSLSLLGRFRDD